MTKDYKSMYESLYGDVARLLVDFSSKTECSEGRYLLFKWDDIRGKYND